MNDTLTYQILSSVVLIMHIAIVIFNVGGLAYIVIGNVRAWSLARSLWFRLVHLASVAIVVAQAWLGATCPLTTIEMWLRAKAGKTTYSGGFIEHWLRYLLYYDAPLWVFTLVYSLFGLVVLATWWYFPPRSKSRNK